MSIVQTVAPTALPVSVETAKLHLRVDGIYEDAAIEQLIRAAVAYCQDYQWAQYITATYVQRSDSFPCGDVIYLVRSPAISITSVQYVDTAGATQTLTVTTDYVTDIYSKPARVLPAYGESWPTTRGHINDVTVTFTAGYGADASTVPENIKHAILLLVGHWYRNREGVGNVGDEIAFAVKALLDLNSYRVFY